MRCEGCGEEIGDDFWECPLCGYDLTVYAENSLPKNEYVGSELFGVDSKRIPFKRRINSRIAYRKDFLNWLVQNRRINRGSAKTYVSQLNSLLDDYAKSIHDSSFKLSTERDGVLLAKNISRDYCEQNHYWRTAINRYIDFLMFRYKSSISIDFVPKDEALFMELFAIVQKINVMIFFEDRAPVIRKEFWCEYYHGINLSRLVYRSSYFDEFFLLGDPVKIKFEIDLNDERVKRYLTSKTLEEKALQGDPDAQYKLGCRFWNENNYEKALSLLTASANNGNVFAQNKLADMYYNGENIDQSIETALHYYEMAAEQGSSEAQCKLGMIYYSGEYKEKDFSRAFDYFKKSAEQESSTALYYIGKMYYTGVGKEKNLDEAEKLFKRSADQGNALAQNELANMYACEDCSRQNYVLAKELYEKAAEQGISDAMVSLGLLFLCGNGVSQSYESARFWFEKGAAHVNGPATFFLSCMYYNGDGVYKDRDRAKILFEKSRKICGDDAMMKLDGVYRNCRKMNEDLTELSNESNEERLKKRKIVIVIKRKKK